MTVRERFLNVMDFKMSGDRLPMVEWAWWWEKTHNRWKSEGLSENLTGEDLFSYFGLDELVCLFAGGFSYECPKSPAYHGAPIIYNKKDYEEILPYLFNDKLIKNCKDDAYKLKERHERGEIIVRLWLDGFFWFPRKLLGIENHLFAFYDEPDLMHRMNKGLAEFGLRVMEEVFKIITPDMVGFAEDMSYNHGPMVSREMFAEFLAPYYKILIPFIKERGVKVLVDSDGDVTELLPRFLELGMDGIYPLERQAGVDIAELRKKYPKLLMMGAYDKMVMSKGEVEMRTEFERLLPVMRQGGFIPSVDHQTPPEVSLENYRTYLRLFKEYCAKAVR